MALEFTFNGMPVGEFQEAKLPTETGRRSYESFSGRGHYEMQCALRGGSPVSCQAVIGGERFEFVVTECPSYGILCIDRVRRLPRLSDVDRAWIELIARESLAPAVRAMVEEAFAQPELRRLFPYLSLDTRLKFSATTEYPYSERYPYLLYVDPDHIMDGPAFELRDGEQRPVRRGDLAVLIPELVSLLPSPP